MARLYIDSDEAKITRSDAYLVNLEFFDGRKYEDLEARRMFPLTGPGRYISLMDSDNKEVAIVRNIKTLMPESQKALKETLIEYYLIPKITKIIDRNEKYGILKLKVETDRGIREFDIRNRQSDIKVIYGNRVLIRDSDDNRYEIPDYEKLDKHSMMLLNTEL